jgi:hypothetical protein
MNNVEYEKRRDEGERGTCRCFGNGIRKKEKQGKWAEKAGYIDSMVYFLET